MLRPDPLVATSALPRGPALGAPAAERPRSPSPRWAGVSAFLFFSASAPAWKSRGCGRSQPAAVGPGRASRAGLPPSAPSHLGLLAAAALGVRARSLEGAQRFLSHNLFFFLVGFFFFPLKGRAAGLPQIRRERWEKMPSPDFSPPLLLPPRSFPEKKKLELEEVCRKASACGPRLLPRRRVRGGPAPVASSVRPFACPQLLN